MAMYLAASSIAPCSIHTSANGFVTTRHDTARHTTHDTTRHDTRGTRNDTQHTVSTGTWMEERTVVAAAAEEGRTRKPMGDFLDLANCSRVAQSRAVDSARTATHQKRLSGTCHRQHRRRQPPP
jgi:hypothetical protein